VADDEAESYSFFRYTLLLVCPRLLMIVLLVVLLVLLEWLTGDPVGLK